eukprot:4355927-Amphidinium_carterae.2
MTYQAANPFTTPFLKLQLDMPLLSPTVPPMTLPSHPTLTSPFHFYAHNERVIKDDFPRLSPYVELLLLGYLRINHVIQEAMCLSPHLYSRDDADHSTHHPRMACCGAVTRQKDHIDHSLSHLWSVVSKQDWSSYRIEEQLTITRINNYLYASWNMKAETCDLRDLPTFPILQNR